MSDFSGDAVSTDLEALQLHLRSILASVPDGMIVIDEKGKILAFSAAAEKLFNYKEEDVIGADVSLLMGGHDEVNHQNYIDSYLETGKRHIIGVGRVVSAKRSDGALFPIDLKIGEARWVIATCLRPLSAIFPSNAGMSCACRKCRLSWFIFLA